VRFKLDENLDARLVPLVAEGGHDVSTVKDEGLSGAADGDVFHAAVAEKRTLLTLDLDFASPIRFPPDGTAGIVVVRVRRPLLSLIEATIRAALPRIKRADLRGKLWIVEPGRIREYSSER
jgi:predicted nuclease of predicted toxin-antitoxin system